jgi:hypothetical protein
MWLLEQCRKEWEKDGTSYDYPTIVKMASSSVGFQSLVDPDHPSLPIQKHDSSLGRLLSPNRPGGSDHTRCLDSLYF